MRMFIDDTIVYHYAAGKYLIVVNASNEGKDWAWFEAVKNGTVLVDRENLGSQLWMSDNGGPKEVTREQITTILKDFFRPEFLNRVDEIVIFKLLTKEDLAQIVGIQLEHVADLLKERGYRLEVTEAARKHLADVGYDPEFGARPLKRAIQREIQDPLAKQILSGAFAEGDTILIDHDENEITFTRKK